MKNRLKAVEMSIFAVVSLVFLNSVYSLFTDGKFLEESARRPIAVKEHVPSVQKAEPPEARSVAAESGKKADEASGFVPYETQCNPAGERFETSAAKVRILGPFCGSTSRVPAAAPNKDSSGAAPGTSLIDYKVENVTSRYSATVFSDYSTGKFSTDFIPLERGANKVVMEFRYKSGKAYPVELTIVRK